MSNCIAFIGRKVGMTSCYKENGSVVPLTVMSVAGNAFLGLKTPESDGYASVVIGGGGKVKEKSLNKPQRTIFKKHNVDFCSEIAEFRLESKSNMYEIDEFLKHLSDKVGSVFNVSQNMKGLFIDVAAVSSGKGFQGGMKRWGFAGLRATHGVSLTHRSIGSTGCRAYPGKVYKGRKMPGRMGGTLITVQNLLIHDVDVENGLIFIIGSVPGKNGSIVYISDSVKKRRKAFDDLNFLSNFKDVSSADSSGDVVTSANAG